MKFFTKRLPVVALAIAATFAQTLPGVAMPLPAAPTAVSQPSNIIKVQGVHEFGDNRGFGREYGRRIWPDGRGRHGWDRRHYGHGGWDRGWRGDRAGWHGGYRGYRERRHGYRYHNGYWFPLAAFGAGALIGGAIAAPTVRAAPAGGINPRHYEWCANRYKSYSAASNTFQPYNGPRQQCYSPYF